MYFDIRGRLYLCMLEVYLIGRLKCGPRLLAGCLEGSATHVKYFILGPVNVASPPVDRDLVIN